MELLLIAGPPWQDYGPLGAMAASLLSLFVWYVRVARRDSLGATARAEAALTAFTRYVQDTSAHQTEALIATASGLQRVLEGQERAETRAELRHDELLRTLRYRAVLARKDGAAR